MQWKRILIFILVSAVSIVSLTSCASDTLYGFHKDKGEKNKNTEELLIAAAASLTDVLEEIGDLYETIDPETSLNFTFGGSGTLQAQIEEGAPVDIFFSASEKQMASLRDGGFILEDSIKILLTNKIVLISPKDSGISIKSFYDLAKDDIDKIAIGDPGNVPVGQYSQEIFDNLGLYDKLREKLILANDVRTVLAWVESGEVACGIVYNTDALRSDNVKIVAEAPEGSHREVKYPVAIVKGSKYRSKAQDFIDFLDTDEVRAIFEKYGFNMK